jgi:hypothetical protein
MGRPGDRRREVLNSPGFPASEDRLVDALIGFANGAEVVMLDKPRERPATVEEKRAHPRAPVELRQRFAAILQDIVGTAERFRPTRQGRMWTQTETWASWAASRGLDPDGTPLVDSWEVPQGDLASLQEQSPIGGMNFLGYASNLLTLVTVKPVLAIGSHGYSIQHFHDFPDLEALLTYAVVLLLDGTKPYGKALCRCKLSTCDRFYLARKNPKGGPENRNYCSIKHRQVAHDSRKHRAEMKAARRHK